MNGNPLCTTVILVGLSLGCAGPSLAEEGKLGISPSGHYFAYKGKTILLLGDSGTQCVPQNKNIEYRAWIDHCSRVGINALHVWALLAPRQKQDGSKVEARYGYVYPGLTPWARKTRGPDATDQLKRWDLRKFDDVDYWPRMRDLCSYAAGKDVIVGITVFFGWPKWNTKSRPDWSYHPFNVVNGGHLSRNRAVQVIHSPGMEVLNEPWSDDWPSARKTQWIWEKYCEKLIRETNSFGNVFYVFMDEHSYPEGNCGDHFLKFFKKRGALWTDCNARRANVDIVYEQRVDPRTEFFKKPFRPHIELEQGPYKGDGVRSRAWEHGISGGSYLMHNDGGQETQQTGIMVYDPNIRGGKKDKVRERERWIGYAARFFNRRIINLDSMVPHDELTGRGERCLADPGREYAVYGRETVSVDLSGVTGSFNVEWYNPRKGVAAPAGKTTGGGVRRFTAPDNNDWVLHVFKPAVKDTTPTDPQRR